MPIIHVQLSSLLRRQQVMPLAFEKIDVGTWDKLAPTGTENFNEVLRLTISWSGLLSANATRH